MLEIRSQSVEPHHRIEVMEVKMEEHNVDLYRDPCSIGFSPTFRMICA